tara:strand:- start:193 stop:480 length:288 start_codon:yes stop_codon:yes gene_type:complete
MNVKLIRMWSGEDVITDVIEKTKDYYIIENPIVAVPSPQEGRIAFAPWSPLLSKDSRIEVTKKYVVYEANPQDDIIEQYNSMYGKISTPTKKLII